MRGWSQRRRLSVVLALNVAMIAALVLTGLLAGSLSLLSSAADFAADSVALLLGLVAVVLRDGGAGRARRDATTLVAAVNGLVLLTTSVVVAVEAVLRLRAGSPPVLGVPVLVTSAVSALVMGVGALVLGLRSHQEDLHMRSVLVDTLADGAAALAVAVGGAIIAVTGGTYWIDPVLAGVIAVVVAVAAVRLLADAAARLRAARVGSDR